MDTQETSLYQIIILAAVVISSILIYSFLTALRQQANYCKHYNKEIRAGIISLENERKRIAADLHDDLGPVLSAAKMKMSVINATTTADKALLDKSIEYIENMTGKIRIIAGGLMPAVLLDKGPVMATRQFIETLSLNHELEIELHAAPLPALNQHASIHLYRILQEIIHNSIKHAQAKKLLINIYANKKQLIVASADNGKGFNYQKTLQQTNGYGLSNIQSRVQLLNGSIHVQSVTGTQYYIEFPQKGNCDTLKMKSYV